MMGTLNVGGETYQTVVIGSREWMSENLRDASTGGVWYDSNPTTYAWAGVMCTPPQVRALVPPDGWRLPNFDDYFDLMTALLAPSMGDFWDAHRRIASPEHWLAGSVLATTATNVSGFSFSGTGHGGGTLGELDEVYSINTGYEGHIYFKLSALSDEMSILSIDRDTPQPPSSFSILSVPEPTGNISTRRYYSVRYVRTVPSVASPVILPVSGTYEGAVEVTITCATQSAYIYFTLDGSDPTTESMLYSQAFSVSETTTVKAIAVSDGLVSSVVSATYQMTPPIVKVSKLRILDFSFGTGV